MPKRGEVWQVEFGALSMESGFDVLLCLLCSVAAFGAVYYIYYGKR